MDENADMTVTCKWCGASLSAGHTGPCPKCGKEGKKIAVRLEAVAIGKASLHWESRREFLEENPKIKWLLVVIDLISLVVPPLFGWYFSGLPGIIVGAVTSIIFIILSWILGPHAVTKIREIRHG